MNEVSTSAVTKTLCIPSVWIVTSVLVSVLVTITSLCGILLEKTYSRETTFWALEAVGTDYTNLAVVIVLLVSTWFVTHHSFRGYLVWLGVYLYLVYAFMIYSFAVHFQFLFLAYILILGLSFYTLVGGLMAVDLDTISPILLRNPMAKTVGTLFLGISIFYCLVWLSEIIPHLLAGTIPPKLYANQFWVNPVHVMDLAFLLPGMFITTFFLWKRKILGYVMAIPLLIYLITMGTAMIASAVLFVMHGLPVSVPSRVIVGICTVFSMGVFYLFLRQVTDVENNTHDIRG